MKKTLKTAVIVVLVLALLLVSNFVTYKKAINTAHNAEKDNYPYLSKVGDLIVFNVEDHGDKVLVYNTNAAGYLRDLTTYTLDGSGNVTGKFIEICTYNKDIANYFVKEEGYSFALNKLSKYVVKKDLEKAANENTKEELLNKFANIQSNKNISTTVRILEKEDFADFNMYN